MYEEEEEEVKSLSHVWLFATPWTVADQAPRSMEFSRHEYWSGLPFPRSLEMGLKGESVFPHLVHFGEVCTLFDFEKLETS